MMRSTSILLSLLALGGVLAACGDGNGGTGPDPLTAPTGLQATTTSNSITITFNAVTGAQSYVVERAPGSGGSFAESGTTTTTSFTDEGLEADAAYRYRIAAVRGTETSPFSGEVAAATSDVARATISADVVSDRTLHSDTIYTLTNFIHVANGATLTIEAGTRIEGQPQSALFILRGAKIRAMGTADAPIVMTSSVSEGQRRPGDWGGLIIIGNGIINRADPVILEGTNTGDANPPLNYAGGNDNTDDSGELHYVRIEFAGFGPLPDAELNSLTMAAVGSGTTIEYVQSVGGLDDSFEWFGGAVDGKYLVSYESGDDHFDASEGYVGRNQFMIALQSTILPPRPGSGNTADDPRGIENDGCAGANCLNGEDSEPFTTPMFANFTLVGTSELPSGGGTGMVIRRGAGGHYVNGIIARWPSAGIGIRDATTNARFASDDLTVSNILLAENGTVFESGSGRFTVDEEANGIEAVDATTASLFTAFAETPTLDGLDWTPPANSPAATGGTGDFTGVLATKAGDFLTGTDYRGAADPDGDKWWDGWTNYARN